MFDEFKNELPAELIQLERALRTVGPAAPQLDRDRVMFESGVACGMARAQAAAGATPLALVDRCTTESQQADRNFIARVATSAQCDAARVWALGSAAAALVAGVFAVLYAIERSRLPVVVREVVMVQPTEQPTAPSSARSPDTQPRESQTSATVPRVGDSDSGVRASAGSRLPHYFLASPTLGGQPPRHYLELRQLVLTGGIDALPGPDDTIGPGPLAAPPTAAELLNEMLPRTDRGA